MNRFGWALLAIFVIAGIGFVLLVNNEESRPQPKIENRSSPQALAIPVAGVEPTALVDTFADARGVRTHGALDIPAPHGTPVIAAAPGRIEKIFESEAGGHTVYVRSNDGRWVQYYAHLDRYADGLREGMPIQRGQAIGAVGSTGNANPEGPHLHFELKRMAPGEKWYQGTGIDPYPLLAGTSAPR